MNLSALIGGKFICKKKSFTRFVLQSECCNFNQWEELNFNRSCDFFKLCYNQIYQLKTTYEMSLTSLQVILTWAAFELSLEFFAQPRRLKALPVLLLNKDISKYVFSIDPKNPLKKRRKKKKRLYFGWEIFCIFDSVLFFIFFSISGSPLMVLFAFMMWVQCQTDCLKGKRNFVHKSC